MAFQKSTCSEEMEFFKAQLKNAADVFDKMPEFEQSKALDIVKDLFHHFQSSLNHANNGRNHMKLINTDISLIEQDLINCLVVETQHDDILNWNGPHLMCEKQSTSEEVNHSNCGTENAIEEQSKSCDSHLNAVMAKESFTSVQLEHDNSCILANGHDDTSAIEEPIENNCDSSCNTVEIHDCCLDDNDVCSGLCNSDENLTDRINDDNETFNDLTSSSDIDKAKNSVLTRRTSQRLANKKNKVNEHLMVVEDEEMCEKSETESEYMVTEKVPLAAKTKANKDEKNKKSKQRVKKQSTIDNCDKYGDELQDEMEYKSDSCQHETNKERSQQSPMETDELNCDECKLKFAHQQHYQKHMSGHHRNNCKLCNAQFAKRKALCRHLRTVHMINEPEKFYHCPHCERKFIKRPSLYVHLKEHAKGKIVCLKCGLMCETKELFNTHMLKHTEEAKFHCKKCNESFLRRQQYEQHLTGHDKYNCTLCDINFSTKKHFLKHKRVVHGIQTREEKKHICFICQKRFQRPMLLEIHMRLHTGEKPIQCTHCDKNFRTPKALAKHMKTAAHLKATGQDENDASEMEKPYLCAQCGTRFYRRQGLIRHMQQLHSEERPYTCPYCDYSCKCKTNLKRHVELHTADRRFVCELCGASFHARATLKEHHAYVHSEDRNFVCSVCGKGFKGRSGLRRHVRIHSDARPYVCYCSQSYKRMSHLKRHMIAIHGALFKSKRVTKVLNDDNSQSSCNEPFESIEHETIVKDTHDDALLLNVQNAVVDLLQISSSSRSTENDSLQVPVQEFLSSNQELLTMSPHPSSLSLPSVSPLSQPVNQMFNSDMASYTQDYPLSSSSSSSSDVANHFTFCMSLSQSAFSLPSASQTHLVQTSCSQFYPTSETTSLLMSNLQDGSHISTTTTNNSCSSEMPNDKINAPVSTVPKMFAHSAGS